MKHETEGLHKQKGRTEQVSQFQRACSQICTCCQHPSSGHFTVGKIYAFKYIIDAQQIRKNGLLCVIKHSIPVLKILRK